MAAGPLSRLIAGKYLKNAAKEAGWGTAANAAFGLMGGGPTAALAYGLGDFALNVPAIALAKGLAPNKQWVHNVANFGASLASLPIQDNLYKTINPQGYAALSNQVQPAAQKQAATVAKNNLQNPQLAGQQTFSLFQPRSLAETQEAMMRSLGPDTLRALGYAI